MAETRDRYTNFFAWIFKIIYKKKNHDDTDREPPKQALAHQPVDRRILRKFCSSIKSMKSMYLYTYFMPMMKKDLSDYDFDFFKKDEIEDFNIFKEKNFFDNEPKDEFNLGNDEYIQSAFEEMNQSFKNIYGIKVEKEELGALKFGSDKLKKKLKGAMKEELGQTKRLGVKGVMKKLKDTLESVKDKRNEQILKQIYCKKDINLGEIFKKNQEFCKFSYQLEEKALKTKKKMIVFTRSTPSKIQQLVLLRSDTIGTISDSVEIAFCNIPHDKKLKDMLVTPHNTVVLITEIRGVKGRASIEELSPDELEWNNLRISGRIEVDLNDILNESGATISEYVVSREIDDQDQEITNDFGMLHANTKNLFSIANDSRILIFE